MLQSESLNYKIKSFIPGSSHILKMIMVLIFLALNVEAKARGPLLTSVLTVNAYMGLVEEYLIGVLRTEKVIAASSEAQSLKWDSIKNLLYKFSQDLSTDATVWFVMPDGSYYSTESGGLTQQNLKDRDYFPRLMAGENILGDLVISKSTGHRSVIVATPVRGNEKIIAGIGVSIRIRLLSELISTRIKFPDNTYFYALTPDAKITLHKYADRMFKQVSDVGDEALESEFKKVLNGDQGFFDYKLKGKAMSSIFQKSSLLNWYFFIAQEK